MRAVAAITVGTMSYCRNRFDWLHAESRRPTTYASVVNVIGRFVNFRRIRSWSYWLTSSLDRVDVVGCAARSFIKPPTSSSIDRFLRMQATEFNAETRLRVHATALQSNHTRYTCKPTPSAPRRHRRRSSRRIQSISEWLNICQSSATVKLNFLSPLLTSPSCRRRTARRGASRPQAERRERSANAGRRLS